MLAVFNGVILLLSFNECTRLSARVVASRGSYAALEKGATLVTQCKSRRDGSVASSRTRSSRTKPIR